MKLQIVNRARLNMELAHDKGRADIRKKVQFNFLLFEASIAGTSRASRTLKAFSIRDIDGDDIVDKNGIELKRRETATGRS